ncbi:MAG: cysteine desulfurase NifS [Candidatus Omnitrophota bacterium]|nr:cysteine desulfurase NifS [Candidatus Omnitrophota bacterium]
MRKVYLDANATTITHPEVIREMLPFFDRIYGNASSVHRFGREARKHLERARVKVAALVHADSPEEIVFTSEGTESDNFAIKGVAAAEKDKGKHIITSSVEHHAVLNTCKYLEKKGFEVTYLDVDGYGVVDLDQLRDAIREDTILISIMAANNETGTIMPIEEIGAVAAGKGVVFHTDAVQLAGKIPFDVNNAGAQLVSLSGHKINGPKGVGALYIRKGTKIEKCQHGGHHEMNYRAGTENVPAIVGFGKASEIALERGVGNYDKVRLLRDKLYDRIKAEISHVRLNGHPEKRLPNTLNVSFEYLEGESVILSLDLEGIAVSTGSACTSGNLEPSHVLKSMGVEPLFAQGSVRFSLDVFNTEQDIEYVMGKLPPIIERLRKMSPVYPVD